MAVKSVSAFFKCCFTSSTETITTIRDGSPGRPPTFTQLLKPSAELTEDFKDRLSAHDQNWNEQTGFNKCLFVFNLPMGKQIILFLG